MKTYGLRCEEVFDGDMDEKICVVKGYFSTPPETSTHVLTTRQIPADKSRIRRINGDNYLEV